MEVHFRKYHGLGSDYLVIDPTVQDVGYTLASGSSSCAAAGAAHKLGMVDNRINVRMPGGELLIEIAGDRQIFMTGAVEGVFEGRFHCDLKDKVYGK